MPDQQKIFKSNMEKYSDPEFYDLQFENYMRDFPLLLEWASRQGGPIIDLACGTGRVTIPLAEYGYEMIGVDLNDGMLARAKEKTNGNHLVIDWVLQDCTALSLHIHSPFIYMTGNSFQHFLTNDSQDKLLQTVYRHLNDGGIFIFGTRFPKLNEFLSQGPLVESYVDQRNRRVTEHICKSYNPLTQVLLSESTREIFTEQGVFVERDNISLRYVFPQEMERIIQSNGFTVSDAYGSWDKEPLCDSSNEMIYVCKKQGD